MRNRLFLISDKQIGTTLHKAVVLQSTIMCHRDITRLCLEYKMPKILIGHHCYNTKTHTLKKKKKAQPSNIEFSFRENLNFVSKLIHCCYMSSSFRPGWFLSRWHKQSQEKAFSHGDLPDSTFSCSSPAGAGFSRCAKTAAKGLAASGSVRYISHSR